MTEVNTKELKEKTRQPQMSDKLSGKSSSLISSSSSSSSDSQGSQSKYQKKQLQSSKKEINDKTNDNKQRKKQKKYSSRSRSHSSSSEKRSRSNKKQKKQRHRNRSRSREDKRDKYEDKRDKYEDKKDKYRNEKYRDDRRSTYRDERSRDKDKRDRRDYRERDRDFKYEDRRDRRDRGRSREKDRKSKRDEQRDQKQTNNNKTLPTEIPMPIEIPMPPIPGQRRRRQRSRSPLGYYRRNQNNNEGQFWDSFSWVPRINYTPNVSSSALVNTKKMRRLMITNIPYEIGITKDDLRDLITRFMTQNYLKDSMNNCPVRDLEVNEEDHTVAVQLSSVEETCRMCKLQKIELFKGTINGIIRLGDSCYGNNIVTQAQNAAQAQAAAFAAINVLENKKTSFNIDTNLNKGVEVSTMIRVTNAVTSYMAETMPAEEMEDYHEDLLEGFSQFGKIVHDWFVKPSQKDICANPGDLFIEYESQQESMKAMAQMQGKFYDERVIKLFYIPREIYYPNYKKDMTPPTIKAAPKAKKQNPFSTLPQISKSSHIASKAQ